MRKLPKPAQRPASIGEGEVTFPEYVRAIQERRLDALERGPAVCPGCGQRVPSGIIIYFAKARYCPACVPMMRRCVTCERMRSVTEFDTVITGKQRVESDCKDCRNQQQLARYHQAMATTPPPTGKALCASCGKTKPVGEFYRNPLWMKQFPFAHTIDVTHRLQHGILQVTTSIHNLSAEPMPVAIGFHPYFQLTDSPRDEWTISVGAGTQ